MSNFVHLAVQVIRRQTDLAFQVILENGQMPWIPKSVIDDADEYVPGDRDITLPVARWFCEKEELEGE